MTKKEQAEHDADIALQYADELLALRHKYGLVVGGCYETQALVAVEVATRIRRDAGLPDPKPVIEQGRHCHWSGGKK